MPSLGFMQSMDGLLEGLNNIDRAIVLQSLFPQCRLLFPQRRVVGYPSN